MDWHMLPLASPVQDRGDGKHQHRTRRQTVCPGRSYAETEAVVGYDQDADDGNRCAPPLTCRQPFTKDGL